MSIDNKPLIFDALFTFNSNSFSIDLFHKNTNTGLQYDFGSSFSHAYEAILARSLISRAYNFCSTYFKFHTFSFVFMISKAVLWKTLPLPLTDKAIKSFLVHIISNIGKRHKANDDKSTLIFNTPFLGPGSLPLKSRIFRLVK